MKETSGQQYLIWAEELSIIPLVFGESPGLNKPKRFFKFNPLTLHEETVDFSPAVWVTNAVWL